MNISDMLPSFEAIQDTFADPQRLHAIMVHLPIGLTAIGLLLTLGVILTGSKVPGLRWTTVFVYLIATLAALWTVQTGEEAEHSLPAKLTGAALESLEKHESLAEFLWIALASTAVLVMLSGIRVGWFKAVTLILALIASVGSVAWVGAIGHHGGDLVYTHQVGVPSVGPKGGQDNPGSSQDGKDSEKDGGVTKDSATKDSVTKDAPTKDDAGNTKDSTTKDATDVKDAKDAAKKDANAAERKLPNVTKKDKTIFE